MTQFLEHIVFARHCNTARTKPNRNRVPTPLGWRQADRLAELLAGYDFDIVMSSPADRAVLTAHRVVKGRGIPVITLDELYPDPEDNGIGAEMERRYWSKLPYGPLAEYLLFDKGLMWHFADEGARAINSRAELLGAKRVLVISHAVISQAQAFAYSVSWSVAPREYATDDALFFKELGEAEAFVLRPDGSVEFIRNDVAE